MSIAFIATISASALPFNVTVTPWCDNSLRVRITPWSSPPQVAHELAALKARLANNGLNELPSALIAKCASAVSGEPQRLGVGDKASYGNLQATVLASGGLTFTEVASGKVLFSAAPSLGHKPPPSAVQYDRSGAAVPAAHPSDLIQSPEVSLVGSKEAGATDIRSGSPHQTSSVVISHPINGAGHLLSALSLSFRYIAGYTGGTHASTVTLSLVDADNGTAVGDALWTSPPLANYSYDHYAGYSPPVAVNVTGLAVAWPRSMRLALTFTNNDRNVQLLLPSLKLTVHWSAAMQPGPFHPSDLTDRYLEANVTLTAGDNTERIFGLGQGNWTRDGGCPSGTQRIVPLLRNGQTVDLRQRKFHVSIPYVYSTGGYGTAACSETLMSPSRPFTRALSRAFMRAPFTRGLIDLRVGRHGLPGWGIS